MIDEFKRVNSDFERLTSNISSFIHIVLKEDDVDDELIRIVDSVNTSLEGLKEKLKRTPRDYLFKWRTF